MNIIYFLLIPFFLFAPSKSSDHALYISIIEIKNEEMKVKVFTDNLDDAIRNDLGSIEGYFQKKIRLQVNDQKISFGLKEITEEGDSQWISFALDTPDEWQSFELEADYFMELFPDQINVVKVLVGKAQYFRLTKQQTSCSFSY